MSRMRIGLFSGVLVLAAGVFLSAAFVAGSGPAPSEVDGFVALPGGTFTMGSERFYPEEGPAEQVTVGPFAISATEVTNDQFAAFVEATGYVTTAERGLSAEEHPDIPADLRQPGSMVFAQPPDQVSLADPNAWWRYVKGADWRHPAGPQSSIDGLGAHPVVQVSPEDAAAYAAWAGGRLPTEAEWEYAARGGLDGADYAWEGGYHDPAEGWKANTWQGLFPSVDMAEDGHHGTAAARSYAPNGYGLYDMIGNVWEYVGDWWVPAHPGRPRVDPKGPPAVVAARFSSPATGPQRVVKGGSWLCAPSYCRRYRPSARQPAELSLGTNHIGFRIVKDVGGDD